MSTIRNTPIVCIPGVLCSAEVFAPQLQALWPHPAVSIANTLQADTIAELARTILASAPPNFRCVGLSMGGFIALEMMRQEPRRVSKLALLGSSARPNTEEETISFRKLLAQASERNFQEVVTETMMSIVHPNRRTNSALREVCRRMAHSVGKEAFARQINAVIDRPDSRPSLGLIAVPTLVVVGDSDLLQPPARSQELADGISGSRLVIVPDCGHWSTLEDPATVNSALNDWLGP